MFFLIIEKKSVSLYFEEIKMIRKHLSQPTHGKIGKHPFLLNTPLMSTKFLQNISLKRSFHEIQFDPICLKIIFKNIFFIISSY